MGNIGPSSSRVPPIDDGFGMEDDTEETMLGDDDDDDGLLVVPKNDDESPGPASNNCTDGVLPMEESTKKSPAATATDNDDYSPSTAAAIATTTRGTTPPVSRRARRPPALFVARPSKQGWGVAEGDAAFLNGDYDGRSRGSSADETRTMEGGREKTNPNPNCTLLTSSSSSLSPSGGSNSSSLQRGGVEKTMTKTATTTTRGGGAGNLSSRRQRRRRATKSTSASAKYHTTNDDNVVPSSSSFAGGGRRRKSAISRRPRRIKPTERVMDTMMDRMNNATNTATATITKTTSITTRKGGGGEVVAVVKQSRRKDTVSSGRTIEETTSNNNKKKKEEEETNNRKNTVIRKTTTKQPRNRNNRQSKSSTATTSSVASAMSTVSNRKTTMMSSSLNNHDDGNDNCDDNYDDVACCLCKCAVDFSDLDFFMTSSSSSSTTATTTTTTLVQKLENVKTDEDEEEEDGDKIRKEDGNSQCSSIGNDRANDIVDNNKTTTTTTTKKEEDEDGITSPPFQLPICYHDPTNALILCDGPIHNSSSSSSSSSGYVCNRAYHQRCHFVPVLSIPRGTWRCLICRYYDEVYMQQTNIRKRTGKKNSTMKTDNDVSKQSSSIGTPPLSDMELSSIFRCTPVYPTMSTSSSSLKTEYMPTEYEHSNTMINGDKVSSSSSSSTAMVKDKTSDDEEEEGAMSKPVPALPTTIDKPLLSIGHTELTIACPEIGNGWTRKESSSSSTSGKTDRYFYAPSTMIDGRKEEGTKKFRSLAEVQRYLNSTPTDDTSMAAAASKNATHPSNSAGSNCYMISVVGKNDNGALSTSKDGHTRTIDTITTTTNATSNNVDTTTYDDCKIALLEKQFEYQSGELKSQLLHYELTTRSRGIIKTSLATIRQYQHSLRSITETSKARKVLSERIESQLELGLPQELCQCVMRIAVSKMKIRELLLGLECLIGNRQPLLPLPPSSVSLFNDACQSYSAAMDEKKEEDENIVYIGECKIDPISQLMQWYLLQQQGGRSGFNTATATASSATTSAAEASTNSTVALQGTGKCLLHYLFPEGTLNRRRYEPRTSEAHVDAEAGGKAEDSSITSISLDDLTCWNCHGSHATDENDMLLCDGRGCYRAFHMKCVEPKIAHDDVGDEDDDWFCPLCTANANLMHYTQCEYMGDDDDLLSPPTTKKSNNRNNNGSGGGQSTMKEWETATDVFPEAPFELRVAQKLKSNLQDDETTTFLAQIGIYIGKSNIDDGSMTINDNHLLVDDDDESDDDDFDHEEAHSYDDESVVEDHKMECQLIEERISREELDALSVSSNDDGSNTSGADNSSMACSDNNNNNDNVGSRFIRRSKRKRFDFSNKITSGDDDDDTSNEMPSLDIGTLDVANIVQGKRRRTQIDYRK